MENIEIERKFLLKSIPKKDPIETINIQQWYRENKNGIWERVRSCHSDKNGFYFVHTIKKRISNMSNLEEENKIKSKKFNKFVQKCKNKKGSRYISKERIIIDDIDNPNLYWEIDVFNNGHHLIVAEIEIPSENYKLIIPDWLKECILIEVTGMNQFSNKNLSNLLH
jgi:CYTH domain-containing protein